MQLGEAIRPQLFSMALTFTQVSERPTLPDVVPLKGPKVVHRMTIWASGWLDSHKEAAVPLGCRL